MNKKKKVIVIAAKAIATLGFTLLFIFNVATVVEKDGETGDLSVIQLQANAQGENPWGWYAEERVVTYTTVTTLSIHDWGNRQICSQTCEVETIDCYGTGDISCYPTQSAICGPLFDCRPI
ncbi:MAG: hypothetical protein QM594_11530 [Niabella sp.]